MADRILLGDIEPIRINAIDASGTQLTGSSSDMFIVVGRESDGWYLDWNDDTFKSSGWTTLSQSVSESNAAISPGQYQVSGGLDTGAITNPNVDDFLMFQVALVTGSAVLRPSPMGVRVDGWAAKIATESEIVSGTDTFLETHHGSGNWNGIIATVVDINPASISAISASVWNAVASDHETTGSSITMGGAQNASHNVLLGNWSIDLIDKQQTMFKTDGVTPVAVFDILDGDDNPTNKKPAQRIRSGTVGF